MNENFLPVGGTIESSEVGLHFPGEDFERCGFANTVGAHETEDLTRIRETPDRGFILSGESYSPIGGDKTEDNLGVEQTWVVKTDSLGNVLWDKTIFSNGHDEEGSALAYDEHCFVTLNYTLADTGGYKSQPSQGDGDYWLVKICDYPVTSSLNEPMAITQLNAYPNPSTGALRVDLPSDLIQNEHINLEILDLTGKAIYSGTHPIKQNSIHMELTGINAGVYFLRTWDGVRTYRGSFIKTD